MLKIIGEALPIASDIVGGIGGMLQNNSEEVVTVVTAGATIKGLTKWKEVYAFFTGELKQLGDKRGVKRAKQIQKWEKTLNNFWLKKLADGFITYMDGWFEGAGRTLKR